MTNEFDSKSPDFYPFGWWVLRRFMEGEGPSVPTPWAKTREDGGPGWGAYRKVRK